MIQCKKDSKETMLTLEPKANSVEQPLNPLQASPPTSERDAIAPITENEIISILQPLVDNFEIIGLKASDMSTSVIAETEFIEIDKITNFDANYKSEVIFHFYVIPSEFKNQTIVESDGMTFEVSKQFQRGFATIEFISGKWTATKMINEFGHINFLSKAERR